MTKADPFTQRRLLDLAEVDRQLNAARHRRTTVPELAEIAALEAGAAGIKNARVEAETVVSDLDKAVRKLDAEIDAVRARADRDQTRMASGQGSSKELEGLQHEIVSLARRQGVLEDDALELMDRKETADTVLSAATAAQEAADADLSAANERLAAASVVIEAEVAALEAQRADTAAPLTAELRDLYEKILARSGIAVGELTAGRCGACRMELEKVELARLRAAPVDEVCRCGECGAILIRH